MIKGLHKYNLNWYTLASSSANQINHLIQKQLQLILNSIIWILQEMMITNTFHLNTIA